MDLILGSGAVALDEPSGLGGQLAPRSAHPVVVGSDFRARTLLIGESLFSKGDPKTHLHEISSGLVGVYGSQPGCIDEVIEFAFPGDVLGLGYLDHHVHYARALIKTQVKCLPLGALAEIIKHDLRAKHRYAVAVQREFAYRRDLLSRATRQNPIARLAAFLLAVSQFNKDEGRDRSIVTDALDCVVVADWLKLDLDALRRALVELGKRQLIAPCDAQGLRLIDLTGLEALAGGSPN
jgi:CRP/FNR family transcriptional regulator